jgi:hypothetical protein
MPLKIHILHSHLDFFPVNIASFSDEHGERFQNDVSTTERRYKRKWSLTVLVDYCCQVTREVLHTERENQVEINFEPVTDKWIFYIPITKRYTK